MSRRGVPAVAGAAGAVSVTVSVVLLSSVAATAYRVIVAARTNVRRHAPGAARVAVRVHRSGEAVLVTVTDDGPTTAAARSGRPRRRGGLGLPGLAERVEAGIVRR